MDMVIMTTRGNAIAGLPFDIEIEGMHCMKVINKK